MITIVVVQWQSAIALIETTKFGGVSRQRAVAVVVTIDRVFHGEPNKYKVRELRSEREIEFLVEDGVEAVVLDDMRTSSVRSTNAGQAITTRSVEATFTNNSFDIFRLVIGMIDFDFDIGIERSVGWEVLRSHELLSGDDIDREGDILALALHMTDARFFGHVGHHLDFAKVAGLQDIA